MITVTRNETLSPAALGSDEVAHWEAFEREAQNRIEVGDKLVCPNKLVERTAKSLRSAKRSERGLVAPKAKECLDVEVAPESIDRACRIMDSLLKGFEQRGFHVALSHDKEHSVAVTVLGETLGITLEESVRAEEHKLTPREQQRVERDPWCRYGLLRYDHYPTGKLSLRIRGSWTHGVRLTWADGKRQRVETCLNRFMIGLVKAAVGTREERLERERRQQEWEEERRRRDERARLREEEKARVDHLLEQVKAWHKAQQIRTYANAVRTNVADGGAAPAGCTDLNQWLVWTQQQADRLDPLTESPPSILDESAERNWFW